MIRLRALITIIILTSIPSVHAAYSDRDLNKNTFVNKITAEENVNNTITFENDQPLINSEEKRLEDVNSVVIETDRAVINSNSIKIINNTLQSYRAMAIKSTQSVTTTLDGDIDIDTNAEYVKGIFVESKTDNSPFVNAKGSITISNGDTSSKQTYGILLENYSDQKGKIFYDNESKGISVIGGESSWGIKGETFNGGELNININSISHIEVQGKNSVGIDALARQNDKKNDIKIALGVGNITVSGNGEGKVYGIKSVNESGGENIIKSHMSIDSGGIGIYAENNNGGNITISSSGDIDTFGNSAAISAKATGTQKSNIIINQGGTIAPSSKGIYAENTTDGDITITNSKGGHINAYSSSAAIEVNNQTGKIITNNDGEILGYVTYSGNNVKFNNSGGAILSLYSGSPIITNNFGINGNFLNSGLIKFHYFDSDKGTNKKATFNNVAKFYHNNQGVIDIRAELNPLNQNTTGNTITITNGGKGNFISNGGTLIVNTYIAPTGGKSDQLIIDNAITAGGSTLVHVIPTADSKFGKLTGDGIEIIKVKGTSSHDAFKLDAPVVNGEYEYGLVKGGAQSANSWFLRNTYGYNPAMGGYLANMKAASNLFAHTIHDRAIAGKTNLLSNTSFFQDLWLRTRIAHSHHHSVNNSFNNRDNTYMTQLGSDIALWQVAEGNLHMGVVGGYGHYKNTTTSKQTGTQANSQMNGYNLGLYGSWFENDNGQLGTYMDAWSQYSWFRNRITGKGNISDAKKYNSSVWSNSIELGYGFSITKNQSYEIILTPQAQFTYNIYNMKNLYDDKSNLSVTNDKGNGLVSRLGARLYGLGAETNQFIQPYLSVDWINSTAKNQLNFSGQHLKDDSTSNVIETKLGLVGNVNDKFSTSAQIGSQWGKDNYNQLQAQLNFNYNF